MVTSKETCVAIIICCFSFIVLCSGDYCSDAVTESQCIAKGSTCRAVMGQQCESEMDPPPCSLDFSDTANNQCCTKGNTTAHIKYLGCTTSDYACLIQCVEYVPTGTIFMVWEGCAFADKNFKDASMDPRCDTCYETVCPNQYEDISWVYYIVEGSLVCIVLAAVLGCVPILVVTIYFCKWKYHRHRFTKRDYKLVPLELPKPDIDPKLLYILENNEIFKKHQIQPSLREDGLIEVPMADGSVRTLTPAKYQRLYISIMKKRAKSLEELKNKTKGESSHVKEDTQHHDGSDQGESSRLVEQGEYLNSSGSNTSEDDDEEYDEKDPLV